MKDVQHRSVTMGVRAWLLAAGVFATALIVWVVLSGALSAFVLLFTGVLFAVALRPVVDRLATRMPFGAAAGVAFGGVLAAVGLITFVLIAPLGAEVQKLVAAAPAIVGSLEERLVNAQHFVRDDAIAHQLAGTFAGSAGEAVKAVGSHLLLGPALVVSAIGNALIIVLLAVGWMLSSDDLARFLLSLLPPAGRAEWESAFATIGSRLSAYVQGIVINGIIVGIAMGIALAFIHVPFALLLAFVVALFQAIPMVGPVFSGVIVLLVVLATAGWTKMVIVAIVFAVIQILDQNVLSPFIFGSRVQVSFLLIIFSTVMGGMLLGIAGAFLAVPAAAVLQVIVVQIVAPAIRKANGAPTRGEA